MSQMTKGAFLLFMHVLFHLEEDEVICSKIKGFAFIKVFAYLL